MSSVKGFNTSIGVQRYDYESLDDKLEKSAITEVFDPAKSYAAGDTAIYQGKLYKRKTAGSRAWNAADWDLTSVLEVAANAEEVAGEIAGLKDAFILQMDEIPDTVQSYTFADGTVSQITHNRLGVAIRTDTFTYGTNTIAEVRTLNTGESLTIVTNLTTLETTVTYAAA